MAKLYWTGQRLLDEAILALHPDIQPAVPASSKVSTVCAVNTTHSRRSEIITVPFVPSRHTPHQLCANKQSAYVLLADPTCDGIAIPASLTCSSLPPKGKSTDTAIATTLGTYTMIEYSND